MEWTRARAKITRICSKIRSICIANILIMEFHAARQTPEWITSKLCECVNKDQGIAPTERVKNRRLNWKEITGIDIMRLKLTGFSLSWRLGLRRNVLTFTLKHSHQTEFKGTTEFFYSCCCWFFSRTTERLCAMNSLVSCWCDVINVQRFAGKQCAKWIVELR